jgi:hypothetical protein
VIHYASARPTLTAVELDHGDELHFSLASGEVRRLKLISTRATIDSSSRPYPLAGAGTRPDLVEPKRLEPRHDARIVLRMHATVEIDGVLTELVRWVGNQRSFYEPWELSGLRIWFDAADALFSYLSEEHGRCRPRKHARFAVQEAAGRICPPLVHPWCPLPPNTLRIEECYSGSDCWMGPYAGADAHGGLDINHPAGTPLWAPIGFDRQGLFASVANGDSNNRWRGYRSWPDGSTWIMQAHHVIRTLVPDGEPVEAGIRIADGAGMAVGAYEHSHFVFGVIEPGASEDDVIVLDPWIVFRQMYRDRLASSTP